MPNDIEDFSLKAYFERHAANQALEKLPPEEKEKILRARREREARASWGLRKGGWSKRRR